MKKEKRKYANFVGTDAIKFSQNKTDKYNENSVGTRWYATQNAITLIALIITIIILLILAGVTINVLIGDNGLFSTAKKAGTEYEKAAAREKLEVAISDIIATKLGNAKLVDLNNIKDKNIKILNVILENDIEANVEVDGKYKFIIDSNFNIYYEEDINDYVEAIFKMPVLTANDSTINGKRYIVSASSVLGGQMEYAYQAFDGIVYKNINEWHSEQGGSQWLQIQFQDEIKIKKFTIKNRDYNPTYAVSQFELQGSNDGENWTSLGTYTNNTGPIEETSFEITNPNFYTYYKWNCGSGYVTIGEIILNEAIIKIPKRKISAIENSIKSIGNVTIDSYEEIIKVCEQYKSLQCEAKEIISNYKQLEDAINQYNSFNVETIFKMPVLTANDSIINGKRYSVSASSALGGHMEEVYQAFDGIVYKNNNQWHSEQGGSQWLQIQFQDEIKIEKFTIKNRDYDPTYAVSQFELQGSNDGENWTSLGTYANNTGPIEETSFEIPNSNFYTYYKWNCGSGYVTIAEIILDTAFMKIHIDIP